MTLNDSSRVTDADKGLHRAAIKGLFRSQKAAILVRIPPLTGAGAKSVRMMRYGSNLARWSDFRRGDGSPKLPRNPQSANRPDGAEA
ncbi:hypothetical protein IT41_18000 [Paracoccus halophilus]|uniref:Uncharacterized protein n=1 Tax=Paracoccus halophilus TaxID=376733 RepID=A0A099EW50_9RHOB|nr:hypothetical protein [Paracoccus halophilus]KGJ02241.1 hypothetical protein IT41_18000 [Paracoccus halophilus]